MQISRIRLSDERHPQAHVLQTSPGRQAPSGNAWSYKLGGTRLTPLSDPCFLPPRVRSQAPSLHWHYPASTVLRACPPPHTAQSGPRGLPVGGFYPPQWGLPVLHTSPLPHMLSSLPRRNRWVYTSLASPTTAAFPDLRAGRLPHYTFRGLLNVHACYGLCGR